SAAHQPAGGLLLRTFPWAGWKRVGTMTHTVCEPCTDCKYTDCVAVCPVECFYQDDVLLYIDPIDCIDCEACVPECPVEAIFAEANVPAQWQHYYADERGEGGRAQGH